MGDWMGSCVDVKLGDRMGHSGQTALLFDNVYMWKTVDPSDLFVME